MQLLEVKALDRSSQVARISLNLRLVTRLGIYARQCRPIGLLASLILSKVLLGQRMSTAVRSRMVENNTICVAGKSRGLRGKLNRGLPSMRGV